MSLPDLSAITVDRLPLAFVGRAIPIDVLRLDKIHPVISGNKWFKLHKYLEIARQENKKRIVSCGGPWSNHIIATAAAAKAYGLPSLGIIRGELERSSNTVLQQCAELGMEIRFMGRSEFDREDYPKGWIEESDLFIPMGGYGIPGMEGASEILRFSKPERYSHICASAGTGTMLAGLIKAALPGQVVNGFSAVKNDPELQSRIAKLLPGHPATLNIETDKTFGGFARHNEKLLQFMNELYEASNIPTDMVYTAKLFYQVIRKARLGEFPEGSRILIIHSGGLTGNSSLKKGLLIW